ncbi:MAG TPA: NYN domain-containing protein [Candidatus Methylomirabilis sp.]|nr:NYN domain-containing protein [Candidatus Methylomirabilis sp.]
MIKRPEQRVAIFIDTQNMYHSAKHLFGARLNFGKLVETMTAGRTLVRAFAYVARSKTGEEKAFLDALQAAGIELRIKDVIEFSSGERKADWDVGMAIDAVKFSERVDVIILVTGDGDFVPLVEYLKGKSIIVEVAAFGDSTAKALRESVDVFFDIADHRRTLLMGSGILRGFKPLRKLGPAPSAAVTDEGLRMSPPNEAPTKERVQELEEEELGGAAKRGRKPSSGGRRKVRVTI